MPGHLSVFPFSPAAVEAVAYRLDGFGLSKGTIRFSADRPIIKTSISHGMRTR